MLTGIHFLLTYKCTFECDHCFVYSSPDAEGVFTIARVENALKQMKETGTVNNAYFEGGEPFLYYPVLLESLALAKSMGFKTGIVTNAYWGESERDAELWLKPIAEIGIDDLSISDDLFHNPDGGKGPAAYALDAAKKLGMPVGDICIDKPKLIENADAKKGEPVIGGGALLKGRAAEKLIGDFPRREYSIFDKCPHEEFEKPSRFHLDPYGNLHPCQGISVGNMWEKPLKDIMNNYNPMKHPILSHILKGGPAKLAEEYGFDTSPGFVDHCHLCYEVRKTLLDRFPKELAPRQVYGL
ncbi:MAG: radical SAM protein [Candidatus Zixiibacteriota bacterium]|nr:MAG: radical SAM protein [candidate division Zixibacteria bacterium]